MIFILMPIKFTTRMHSSKMRTVHCSGHQGKGMYPSMHWACVCVCVCVCVCMHWAWGSVCPGVSAWGVCPWGCLPGGCLPRVWCLLRGVYLGVFAQGGLPGWVPTTHTLRSDTPPPVNRITDACENITLPQLR